MPFRDLYEPPPVDNNDTYGWFQWLRQGVFNKLSRVEEWHYIGASGEPAFAGNWQNLGSGRQDFSYYKDPFGRIHLSGAVTNGNQANITTLPKGYYPLNGPLSFIVYRSGVAGSLFGICTIANNGAVNLYTDTGGIPSTAADWYFFDGVSFRVD